MKTCMRFAPVSSWPWMQCVLRLLIVVIAVSARATFSG